MTKDFNPRSNLLLKRLLLLLGSVFFIIYLFNQAKGNGDFKVFLEAAKLVKNGENPYNKWLFVSEGNYCKYFYSPLWALMLVPFTYLPHVLVNALWLLANVFFIYRIWNLLKLHIHFQDQRKMQIVGALTLLLSIRFILYNLDMLQMTLFMIWAMLESLNLIHNQKNILGAGLLALVINIKIMPIVLLPYIIYRRYFKAGVLVTIASIILLIIPSTWVGFEQNKTLNKSWWQAVNPNNSEHLIETDLGLHSLTSAIPILLTETTGEIPLTRNIFNLSQESSILIMNSIRILLIVSVLFILKWPPFRPEHDRALIMKEVAYIFLLMPLIFPHQQKYAFAFIIPSVFYLVSYLKLYKVTSIRTKCIFILMVISFACMTLTTDGLIGRELSNITQHLKTITWGSLLLIPSMFLATASIADYKD